MKGQVLNVDFAIAAGLFVTGVAAALTITFTLWQAPQGDLEDRLTSEALQVGDSFASETGWTIKKRDFSSSNKKSFLKAVKVRQSDTYVKSGNDLIAFDRFGDFIVFESEGDIEIGTSENGLSNISGSADFDLNSAGFSNGIITVNYSDTALEDYKLEGESLIEKASLQNEIKGSQVELSITEQDDWNAGLFNSTSADRGSNSGSLGIGYLNGTIAGQSSSKALNNGSLVGYWRFDEKSGSAKDYSGSERDAAIFNDVSGSQNGIMSTDSYGFNLPTDNSNEDDFLNLSQNYQFSDSQSFSVSFWYRRYENDVNDRVLGFDTTSGWGFLFDGGFIDGGNDMVFRWNSNVLETDKTTFEGVWYHATVTYDGSGNLKLYHNGTQVKSASGASWNKPSNDFIIGSTGRGGGVYDKNSAELFNGRLDEVRLYNRSLSPSEVEKLYFHGRDGEFGGNYSYKIDRSQRTVWKKLEINASIPSDTEATVEFKALDSDGNVLGSTSNTLQDGLKNYSLDSLSSEDGRIIFNGTSTNVTRTWKVHGFKVHKSRTRTVSGNLSAMLDFGSQKVFLKGGSEVKPPTSLDNQTEWDSGSYSETSASDGVLRLGRKYEEVQKTGFYKPNVSFDLKHTFMSNSTPNGGSWGSVPNQKDSSNPEPPYSDNWSLQNNSEDADNQMYGSGWNSYTFDSDDWFLTWIRFTESSPPEWLMVQLHGWNYRIQTGGSSCRYSPCNITDIEEPEPGEWSAFLFRASDTDNNATGTSKDGVAWTPPDTSSPNQAFYVDSGLAVENPEVFSNYSATGSYTSNKIDNTEITDWKKIMVNASVPKQTSLKVVFEALDSSGATVDTFETKVDDGLENYTINLQNSEDGRIKFIGSTDNDTRTWRVYNTKVYSGSRAARDVYVHSTGESTNIEVKRELDMLEITENSTTHDLNQSITLSGDSPLVFYGSKALSVSGPGIEWTLEGNSSDSTNLSIEGSHYISGFADRKAASERASSTSKYSSRFITKVKGTKTSKYEALFKREASVFENDLGISSGISYNISFSGKQKGEKLPLSGTVVSRSIPQTVLHPNGTVSEKELEVRLWR